MTTENAAEVAEQVEDKAAPEAAVSSQEQVENRDWDKEAAELGWVPEAEFRGPKEKWKPADQFVKDGEKILPIVRSQLKKAREDLEKEQAEFAKRVERLEKVNRATLEREKTRYEAEIARLKSAREEAVEAGDVAEFKKLDTEISKLKAPEVEEDKPADNAAIVAEWGKTNKWYGSDDDLTVYAEGFSQKLARDNPNMSLADNLAKTEAKVKAMFPDKFGAKKPAANGHAAVDGGGSFPGARRAEGKAYADLPAEAKAACDRFVASKVMTKEQYVKDYFNE